MPMRKLSLGGGRGLTLLATAATAATAGKDWTVCMPFSVWRLVRMNQFAEYDDSVYVGLYLFI